MKRKSKTGEGEAILLTPTPGAAVTPVPELIDADFEEALPAGDTCHPPMKSRGWLDGWDLALADAIVAIVAVTAIADLAQHRHAITPWAILLLGAFRAKTVLLERMPLSWPSWLAEIVAFGLPSALMWGAIMWAT
jgi:hypothetical protein